MNNLQDDYRGKPHEPSPCALPGAQGRLGQSISYRHGLELIALGLLAVGSPHPGDYPEFRRGEDAPHGRGGSSAQDVQPRGQSWWEQGAAPRQPRAENHRCHHCQTFITFFLPISRGHFPAGTVTPHSSFHHSTGQELAQHRPARATQPTPPTGAQQVWGKSKMDPPRDGHSWSPVASPPLPEQGPEPLIGTGEDLVTGAHCSTSPKNKTQKLQS